MKSRDAHVQRAQAADREVGLVDGRFSVEREAGAQQSRLVVRSWRQVYDREVNP